MDDDARREARHHDRVAAFDRWTTPRPPEPAASAPPAWTRLPLAAQEARWHAQWERERRERIRRGACADCGERLCPRVGGSDWECVVGG